MLKLVEMFWGVGGSFCFFLKGDTSPNRKKTAVPRIKPDIPAEETGPPGLRFQCWAGIILYVSAEIECFWFMKVGVMKVWGGLLGCTGACAMELKPLPILFSSGPDSNYTGRAVGLRSYLNPK